MKISVITAAYKSKETIGEAIASVANQTYPDVEHIVIEGSSGDGTLEEILRSQHKRMRLISEPDSGVYEAFNKGLKNVTGDVIGFIHSDDVFKHDDVLTKIAEAFSDPNVEAVYSDLDYVSKTNTSNIIRRWTSCSFQQSSLKYGWMPAHPTLYLRREAYESLGKFDQNMNISGDYDFILRYFSQTTRNSVYIPEVLYNMRVGGLSNRSWAMIYQKIKEDMIAIRRNKIGGYFTLLMKNMSKVTQYLIY